MKGSKKLSLLIIAVFLMSILTGCSGFDASKYVEACLDANAHGEFDAYASITNSSKDEIEKQYNDMLNDEISYLDAYNIDDETKGKFKDLFTDIYKSFKYEVGEATKNDDKSYTVPVTVYKLYAFDDILKQGEAHVKEYAKSQLNGGKTPTTDDLYKEMINFMYDFISKKIENPNYGEATTITVQVAPTANNPRIYEVSETELRNLLESMIDLENMSNE